jgi:hypothetical protein
MAQIIVRANIVVPNGPKFALNRTIEIDAYDQIEATLKAATGTTSLTATQTTVPLIPNTVGQVEFIAIVSDWFGDDLTYTVNAGTVVHKFDQPLLLTGEGAASLLDPTATKLIFSNASTKDAKIQILIGRDR